MELVVEREEEGVKYPQGPVITCDNNLPRSANPGSEFRITRPSAIVEGGWTCLL